MFIYLFCMGEQKYALYVEDRDELLGTLKESSLGVIDDLVWATGKKYRVEKIGDERAREIVGSLITKLSLRL